MILLKVEKDEKMTQNEEKIIQSERKKEMAECILVEECAPIVVDEHAKTMRDLIVQEDIEGLKQFIRDTKKTNVLIDNFVPAVKYAMETNKYKVARVLVEAGADMTASTTSSPSAYWAAVRYDKLPYMQLFLSHTSKSDLRELRNRRYGRLDTLLHAAVRYASPRMVQLLLSYGFDPNVQNEQGETPLHLLDLQHSKQMANAFFNVKGAIKPDFSIRNIQNLTAEQASFDSGVRQVLRMQRKKYVLSRQKMSYIERRAEMQRRDRSITIKRFKRWRERARLRGE